MKSEINVTLLHKTPLWIASTAIRTCRDNHYVSDSTPVTTDGQAIQAIYPECLNEEDFDTMIMGERDTDLIDNIANKFKHESTVEHINFAFYINNLPRAVLMELSRHRIASYTVKSSRYTLKELKKESTFFTEDGGEIYDDSLGQTLIDVRMDVERASKYLYFTGESKTDSASVAGLERLMNVIKSGVSIDYAKFSMPESYLTELTFSINARSLKHLLALRSAKDALWAIRELASAILAVIPEEYLFLLKD